MSENSDAGRPPSGAFADASRPRRALIVSTGRDRGALAAARSLHRSGWVVGIGTPDGGGMLGSTRACSARYVVPKPRQDGAAFVEGVTSAVRAGSYDVVFGGADDWMAALSAYRDAIPTRVAHPPHEVVSDALDRTTLAAIARRAGLDAPHTEPATDAALEAWSGPLIVKSRTHWFPGQSKAHRIEARLFADAHAARPRIEEIRRAGAEAVIQAPVEGSLGALIGIFRDGRLDGRVQQVASRLWPTPSGASARAETVRVDESLVAKAEALLADLGWWGLVELQFLTGDDGIPHLIDLNGRFYGSMALANAARPGLADAWGRLVLGEHVAPLSDAPQGVRYAWTAGDLRRARSERRGGLVPDVAQSLRWAWGARRSVWDLRDLGPAVHVATARLRRLSPRTGPAAPR